MDHLPIHYSTKGWPKNVTLLVYQKARALMCVNKAGFSAPPYLAKTLQT